MSKARRHVNLDKFHQGRKLPNKRAACRPMIDHIRASVLRKSPKSFHALVLPADHIYDVRLLREIGVPDENISAEDKDKISYQAIRSKTKTEMTDGPLNISFRIALEQDKKFDWMNLDFCGFIHPIVHDCTGTLSKYCFTEDCFLMVTAKCARENSQAKEYIYLLAQSCQQLGIPPAKNFQEAREQALFYIMTAFPQEYNWFVQDFYFARYREDRLDKRSAAYMICFGASYSQSLPTNYDQKILNLWRSREWI